MQNTTIIRKFTPSDLEAIILLFKEAVSTINSSDYSCEQIATWISIDKNQWQSSFIKNIVFVAEHNTVITGFVDMTHNGYLDHLYVHKDYLASKGNWIALKLMKAIEIAARNHGITTITTDCSITAKKPAERFGFVVQEERLAVKNNVTFINYAMEKKLNS